MRRSFSLIFLAGAALTAAQSTAISSKSTSTQQPCAQISASQSAFSASPSGTHMSLSTLSMGSHCGHCSLTNLPRDVRIEAKAHVQKSWQTSEPLHNRIYPYKGVHDGIVQRSEAFYLSVRALIRAAKVHSHFVVGFVPSRGRCREALALHTL